MYMSNFNRGNNNVMIVLGIVCLIIGFTFGLVQGGAGGTDIPDSDEDSVFFGNQRIYTDEVVATEYFWLTGVHLGDIGNPHNSLAMKTFEIATLEVNQFTYLLSISDEGAEIFIVKVTPEGDEPFVTLAYYNETAGDVSDSVSLTSNHSVRVYIFYEGVHLVSIEGIFDYV